MSCLGVSLDVRRRRIVWPETLPPTPWFAKEISIPIKDLFYKSKNPRHQEDVVQRDWNSARGEIVTIDPVQTNIRILQKPEAPARPTQVDHGQLRKVYRVSQPGLAKRTEFLDRKDSLQKMEQQFRSF